MGFEQRQNAAANLERFIEIVDQVRDGKEATPDLEVRLLALRDEMGKALEDRVLKAEEVRSLFRSSMYGEGARQIHEAGNFEEGLKWFQFAGTCLRACSDSQWVLTEGLHEFTKEGLGIQRDSMKLSDAPKWGLMALQEVARTLDSICKSLSINLAQEKFS